MHAYSKVLNRLPSMPREQDFRPLSARYAGYDTQHAGKGPRPPSSRWYQCFNYRRLSILNTFTDVRYLYKQTSRPRKCFYKKLISTFTNPLDNDFRAKKHNA